MPKVLVAYATRAGSTAEAAERVARRLCAQGLSAEAKPVAEVTDLGGYDAVVLYNNVSGVINATVEGTPPVTIPVVTTLRVDGVALLNEIAGASTTITWSDETASFVNPTGGLVSDFSSYGLAADLTLKPDVAAPGGSIRSTYPLEKNGFATLSGTSMAAPHVSGVAAAFLSVHREFIGRPDDVKRILMDSASDLGRDQTFQGRGLVDAMRAIQSV